MLLTILIAVAAAGSAAMGWGAWRSRWGIPLLAGATISVALILVQAAGSVGSMLHDSWNFIRLAPSFALLTGDPLYPGAGEGPVLGWIYGPVLPWLNVPAILLPGPVPALVASGILNELMLLAPLFWLCRVDTARGRLEGLVLLGAVHAGMLLLPASRMWLRNIHADTPALALGLMGLGVLAKAAPGEALTRCRLSVSAALLVLAAFGKQVEVGVVPAAVLYVGLREGLWPAVRFGAAVAGMGTAAGLVCLAGFGPEGFLLNVIRIPASHPWDGGPLLWARELLVESLVPLALFGILVLAELRGSAAVTARERLPRAFWGLPAAGALTMLPLSLLGRCKLGASEGANHCVYYLVAALFPLLAAWFPRRPLALGTACLATGLGFAAWEGTDPSAIRASFVDSRIEREHRFAEAHRDQVWFLDNPLATAYSDGKLYDQGYGIFDRGLAGLTTDGPDPRRPAALRWVSTPGPPFWQPAGLDRVEAPVGLDRTTWYSPR